MHRKTTLTSGLRVLSKRLDGVKSVTALVLVKAGSRWEDKEINGISHFLEHMFFKGAERFKSAKEVSGAIDSVGGEFNAFTGKEYAGYYVKLVSEQTELAMDVLSDMMLNARFDQEEIEKERGVILEEFNMYQDTPMYQVAWNFERALFGDQPLGWDEIGEKEIIRRLQREDFVAYKESLYTPANMTLVLAGDIDHEQAVEMAEKYFPMEAVEATREKKDFVPEIDSMERVTLQTKQTEQAHLVCGYPGIPKGHPDHYTLKVLASILGGNMSSRMFLAVREAKGLAYYISTSTENYLDTGTLYTRAGVDVNRIDDAVRAIMEEYDKLRFVEIPEEELKKGKEYLKGKLALTLEDSESVAMMLARHELLYDNVESYNDICKAIDAVTTEDIKRLANELIKPEKLHLSVIGPYDDKERFVKVVKGD